MSRGPARLGVDNGGYESGPRRMPQLLLTKDYLSLLPFWDEGVPSQIISEILNLSTTLHTKRSGRMRKAVDEPQTVIWIRTLALDALDAVT